MDRKEFEEKFKVGYAKAESKADRAFRWLADTGVTAAIAIVIIGHALYGAYALYW